MTRYGRRVENDLADITDEIIREQTPAKPLPETLAARIVYGSRPWKIMPGKTPRAGASCTRPLCGSAATVVIEREGGHRPQSVCASCASLLTAGGK